MKNRCPPCLSSPAVATPRIRNPGHFPTKTEVTAPANEGDGDYGIAPPYAEAPEMKVKDGVPRRTIHEFNGEQDLPRPHGSVIAESPSLCSPAVCRGTPHVDGKVIGQTPHEALLLSTNVTEHGAPEFAHRPRTTVPLRLFQGAVR